AGCRWKRRKDEGQEGEIVGRSGGSPVPGRLTPVPELATRRTSRGTRPQFDPPSVTNCSGPAQRSEPMDAEGGRGVLVSRQLHFTLRKQFPGPEPLLLGMLGHRSSRAVPAADCEGRSGGELSDGR